MATQPFFVPQKEIELFDDMNEELIDEIVGQAIDIYKVSISETDTNIYGEAKGGGAKTFESGFQVNCLIQYGEPDVDQNEFGPDVNANIEMYFHRNSLSGSNFYPEIGDIVDWNGFYFEVNGVTEPQLIAGHPSYKHQVKATATRTRLSSINLEERPR
jgi:hypothetical protein